jgi:hypothetical protein
MYTEVNNSEFFTSFCLFFSGQRGLIQKSLCDKQICAFFSVQGFVRKMFHSDQFLWQAAFEMGEETHVGLPVHNCH